MPFFFLLNSDFYFTNRSEIFIEFITIPSIEPFSKITGIFPRGIENGFPKIIVLDDLLIVFGFLLDEPGT